jgi:hypothetical protein
MEIGWYILEMFTARPERKGGEGGGVGGTTSTFRIQFIISTQNRSGSIDIIYVNVQMHVMWMA